MDSIKFKIAIPSTLVFVICLFVYILTMPKTIGLEDDGLFVMSAYFNGIAHPPGYPLYSLISHLFSMIPIGSMAARIHALSAVFGALTCVFLYLSAARLYGSKNIALIAAFAYSFSSTFWSQAIIAEVYSFNTFFFAVLIYLALKIYYKKEREQTSDNITSYIFWFVAIYSLSLSNHWPLMILSSSTFLVLLWTAWRDFIKGYKVIIFLAIIGLLPYLWMVVNLYGNPFISFYGQIDSWEEFLIYISRHRYSDTSDTSGFQDKINFIGYFFSLLAKEFTIPGFAVACYGVYKRISVGMTRMDYAFLLGILTSGPLLIMLLGFDYDDLHRSIIKVYFLPTYFLTAIFFGYGILYLKRAISEYVNRPVLVGLFLIIIPINILVVNYEYNNRSSFKWGELYAMSVLNILEPNSVLFVTDDITTCTIGYLRYVENIRPDVTLINDSGLVLGTRLFDPRLKSKEEKHAILLEYFKSSERPVYITRAITGIGLDNYWLAYKINKQLTPTQHTLYFPRDLIPLLDMLIKEKNVKDEWTKQHKQSLLTAAIPHLMQQFVLNRNNKNREMFREYLNKINNNLSSYNVFMAEVDTYNLYDDFGGYEKIIETGDALFTSMRSKSVKAIYLYLRYKSSQSKKNKEDLFNSLRLWPDLGNPALSELHRYYQSINDEAGFKEVIERIDKRLSSKKTE